MNIVNDITTLNPIEVKEIFSPKNQEELIDFVKKEFLLEKRPFSIAGGRFSMGGQTAVSNSINIDISNLNKIINYDPKNKNIIVEAGCLWRNIQEIIDKNDLSIKIMQTYSNFTVGGSLGVNVHGRYIGLGPIILSVNRIKVLLTNGITLWASPTENKELFFGNIGCFGALSIILEIELSLTNNTKIKQFAKQINLENYLEYFKENIRNNKDVVFNNADIYPNDYNYINVVSWISTNEELTQKNRLIKHGEKYPIMQYLITVLSERTYGKWIRRYVYDKLFYKINRVYTRNYEASYDAGELEPKSRDHSTFVLNEYFIPFEKINDFVPKMAEIYKRFNVNVLNISIRHSKPDSGSYLSWAKEEMFCFVVYYKEYKNDFDKISVPVWTREIINLINSYNGSFYLPYQPHATYEQFSIAYPNKDTLFNLKKIYDPAYQLRNSLWNKYYLEYLNPSDKKIFNRDIEFNMLSEPIWYDKTYLFLQNVFNIKDNNKFFNLILKNYLKSNKNNSTDIYLNIKKELNSISSFKDIFKALKSLYFQKKVMFNQTSSFNLNNINNYLEIGTTGRYIKGIKKAINKESKNNLKMISIINETKPNYSLVDLVERGNICSIPNYSYLDYSEIKSNTKYDLISCYIGLHHCPLNKLDTFLKSISDNLNSNGYFILREHDAYDQNMETFVSLIHSIFNIGLDISEEDNKKEERNFKSLVFWETLLNKYQLEKIGDTIYQKNDPSLNGLMLFRKK